MVLKFSWENINGQLILTFFLVESTEKRRIFEQRVQVCIEKLYICKSNSRCIEMVISLEIGSRLYLKFKKIWIMRNQSIQHKICMKTEKKTYAQ